MADYLASTTGKYNRISLSTTEKCTNVILVDVSTAQLSSVAPAVCSLNRFPQLRWSYHGAPWSYAKSVKA